MGLPQTLGGITGFILFVVILLGMTATDLFPDESSSIQKSQSEFQTNLGYLSNGSNISQSWTSEVLGVIGLDGIYDFISNIFSLVISFVEIQVGYLVFFLGISALIPSEFYLLFALISSSAIIAIVKLLFLSGE